MHPNALDSIVKNNNIYNHRAQIDTAFITVIAELYLFLCMIGIADAHFEWI